MGKMRILLTGQKGYIGSVMAPLLVAEGHDVTGFDSDLFEACTFGDGLPEIRSIRKDIRDITVQDCEGMDAVVHLAALSNDPLGDLNPDLTFEINHRATIRLARVAKEAGVQRFLFSSSCSNYGAARDEMLTEQAKFNPVTPYGQSKVLAEVELQTLADSKFSPTYLRSTTAYGVSPRMRFDIVLNNLVAWAFTTGRIFIKSDGTPWRPIVHIEDICAAFIAVLRAPLDVVHDQAFNVGITSENFQIRDLAEIVREIVPDCRIEYAADAGPDKRSYRVDFSKIGAQLPEFKPKWNARKGAMQLHETYKKYGIKLDDFEGVRYKRIDHIRQLLASGKLDSNLRWVKESAGVA